MRIGYKPATAEQARVQFACGPDPKRHPDIARRFADPGFDHLVAMNAGPGPDGFIDFFAKELAAPLRHALVRQKDLDHHGQAKLTHLPGGNYSWLG